MTGDAGDEDRRFMAMALELAARADFATSPNPMVGCVVVNDGDVVGGGYHHRAGEPHAETHALAAAGDRARGATAYVTLEPCSHVGRTPPCTDALIAAGVRRCVIATRDANPRVSGADALRAAGIEVIEGVLEAPARALNEFFLTRMATGRPFVTAHLAASLDGRVATRTGVSQWISSPESRRHAHRLRHMHDAIVVGVGTVLADDPALTTRDPEATPGPPRHPRRVVLDSALRTPPAARILDGAGTIIVTTADADESRKAPLRARGAEVLELGAEDGRVDAGAVLDALAERDIISVLVEGGPAVLGSFFDGAMIDKVVAYIAPRIVGGAAALSAVGGLGIAALGEAGTLRDVVIERRGGDIVVSGYMRRASASGAGL